MPVIRNKKDVSLSSVVVQSNLTKVCGVLLFLNSLQFQDFIFWQAVNTTNRQNLIFTPNTQIKTKILHLNLT